VKRLWDLLFNRQITEFRISVNRQHHDNMTKSTVLIFRPADDERQIRFVMQVKQSGPKKS